MNQNQKKKKNCANEGESENYPTPENVASENCNGSVASENCNGSGASENCTGNGASENCTSPENDTSDASVPPLGDYSIYESDTSSENCKNRYSNENDCDCDKCWNYVRTANNIYSRLEVHKPGPCSKGLRCGQAIQVIGLTLPTEEEMAKVKPDHSCGINKNKMIASNVIRLGNATMLIPNKLKIHSYKTECNENIIEIL